MKIAIISLLLLSSVLILNSCDKKNCGCTDPASTNYNADANEDDGTCEYAPTTVATEEWSYIMDADSSNYGQLTYEKKSDGSITSSGSLTYQETVCTFQDAIVSINDTIISFTASGTATNPTAPGGNSTSSFTLDMNGSAHNGESQENYSFSFPTYGWASVFNCVSVGTRVSGSGITN